MSVRIQQWPHDLSGGYDRKSCGRFLMASWIFLVAPELHKHLQKKTAHRDQTCQNDDRHEILSFGALVGLSPHCKDHHSETTVKKS